MARSAARLAVATALLGLAPALAAAEDDPGAIAFFESAVRPILVERCVSCHGPEKQKAGLRLDLRTGAIDDGGDSGPPVVPGDPGASLLIEAIRYDSYIQMPPTGKLPDDELETLTEWVARGAPWPAGDDVAAADAGGFDLAARAEHWSLRPVRRPEAPEVEDGDWPRNPIDRFVLARLEAAGLAPNPEADRRTLVRRATFDLIGLPPTPEEVDAFVADDRPDAYERLVDRLLASPRYGERWARHWLDLVRYAETSGHEFDYDILTAYRYRDYVVRAFNLDLPYDRFVVEHLAGDLLDEPRRHPSTGTDESILGTAFLFLAEGTHSPVDVREDMRARVDNQIDVIGKAFLAATIACARCHDHKFDAIPTTDYYALAGYLQSTRHQYAIIDPPGRIAAPIAELQEIRSELARLIVGDPAFEVAGLDECEAGELAPLRDGDEPLDAFDAWYPSGVAFGSGITEPGAVRVEADGVAVLEGGWAHSGAIARPLVGVLRSPTFTIESPFLHVLAAGNGGRINVVIDGFEKIRAPIYGGLTVGVDHGDEPRWLTIDLSMWAGHRAYVEVADGASANYTGGTSALWPGDGEIAVGAVVRSEHGEPPGLAESFANPPIRRRTADADLPAGAAPLVDRYREVAASLPAPTLALAAADGTGIDVAVHVRGSTRNLGETAHRRFLKVLTPEPPEAPADGSGRLELARRIADPQNPLTARVLVNRLWQHHHGAGIVATPDDFGHMGTPPTHPELLDWLAGEFVRSGWSIKQMHRLMMTSAAYRMSSHPRPDAETVDPENALLHRMNVRRLEAEAIRDAILAVSGGLVEMPYGPSVSPHLTPFMEGRGRPSQSGPLDGDGRRSLYVNIRRNFLPPLFLAFDYPSPASTIGRRTVSNVPAQALTLLNDPFVVQQARRWADRAAGDPDRPADRVVADLYRAAFGRAPSVSESERALAFVDAQAGATGDRPRAWADLCHVLLNAKEFLYID